MPITITADKSDELPEGLRPTAKENGGKFVVDAIPEGWGIDNVAATRGKLTRYEQDLKRRDERLKAFAKDDKGTLYEPDEFQSLVAEHRTLKESQGKAPNVDELRKQIAADAEARYGKKLTEAEKRAIELERELDNTTLNAEINALVAEMRPKDGKADVARLLLQQALGIDKADGKRAARVRSADGKDWQPGAGPDGYLTPKDYAMNVLRIKHADMFQGDGQSGAGAGPSGGGAGGRRVLRLSRADLKGQAGKVMAQHDKALADGLSVEWTD